MGSQKSIIRSPCVSDPAGFPSAGPRRMQIQRNAMQCITNRKSFARSALSHPSLIGQRTHIIRFRSHVLSLVEQNAYLIDRLTVTIRSDQTSRVSKLDRRVLRPVSVSEGKIFEVIFIAGR
jgi:hypothetical protein